MRSLETHQVLHEGEVTCGGAMMQRPYSIGGTRARCESTLVPVCVPRPHLSPLA